MEVAGSELKTENLDHHGLVASVCQELQIARRIDELIYKEDTGRNLTPGKAVEAMIINGLGFTNRRLYLTSQFFQDKPVEKLLGKDIQAKDITNHALGLALDDINEYGETSLYGRIAMDIALEHKLFGHANRIDTTSFSVEGEYEQNQEPGVVNITHGFSKNHRPDLKQLMLSLVVTGPSKMPIWMEALDGNSSDKESFHETIKAVNEFKAQLNIDSDSRWIADSALYTKDKLLKDNNYLWTTRVPETSTEAKNLVAKNKEDLEWRDVGDGYEISSVTTNYGGIDQRWLLVYSEKAYEREKKTLEKNVQKERDAVEKKVNRLERQVYQTEEEAKQIVSKAVEKDKYTCYEYTVEPVMGFKKPGRPSANDQKEITGYKVKGVVQIDEGKFEEVLRKKGRFILATNDLDRSTYSDETILNDYKGQQDVEGGFKFIKDPWFMVDSIFLKKLQRVSALTMVMTLCLMVYNILEYRIRSSLAAQKETLPNQKGVEISNPTSRWIFQLMEGICIVRFFDGVECAKEVVTNLHKVRMKIIQLVGVFACKIYGLIPENAVCPL